MARKNEREYTRSEIGQMDDIVDKMEAASSGKTMDEIGTIAAKYLAAVEVLQGPIKGSPEQLKALKNLLERFKGEAEAAFAECALDGTLPALAAEIERQRSQNGDPCNLVDDAVLTAYLRQSRKGHVPSLADIEGELEKHHEADLMPFGNDLRKAVKKLGLKIQTRGN